MTSHPLVSCLTVTEDRRPFLPWLVWCFDRQRWPSKELVIVDSSASPGCLGGRCDVRVIHAAPGTSVPEKRNRALATARGELLAWFDDDDWQHPERLAQAVKQLEACPGAPCAGPATAWTVDLLRKRAFRYAGLEHGVLFNGAVFAAASARRACFDPRRRRASDSAWIEAVLQQSEAPPVLTAPNFFWLLHGNNLSLSLRGRLRTAFSGPFELSEVRSSLGAAAWSDTDEQLHALELRLARSRGIEVWP